MGVAAIEFCHSVFFFGSKHKTWPMFLTQSAHIRCDHWYKMCICFVYVPHERINACTRCVHKTLARIDRRAHTQEENCWDLWTSSLLVALWPHILLKYLCLCESCCALLSPFSKCGFMVNQRICGTICKQTTILVIYHIKYMFVGFYYIGAVHECRMETRAYNGAPTESPPVKWFTSFAVDCRKCTIAEIPPRIVRLFTSRHGESKRSWTMTNTFHSSGNRRIFSIANVHRIFRSSTVASSWRELSFEFHSKKVFDVLSKSTKFLSLINQ